MLKFEIKTYKKDLTCIITYYENSKNTCLHLLDENKLIILSENIKNDFNNITYFYSNKEDLTNISQAFQLIEQINNLFLYKINFKFVYLFDLSTYLNDRLNNLFLTKKEIANKLKISYSKISLIFKDPVKYLNMDLCIKISKVLHLDIFEFLSLYKNTYMIYKFKQEKFLFDFNIL